MKSASALGPCLALLLAGCAANPPAAPRPQAAAPAPSPAAPGLPPLPLMGGDAGFQAYIRGFEPQAVAAGITPDTYGRAMAGIAPLPGLAQTVQNQPEFVKPIWTYLDSAVSDRRIRDAQGMLAAYGPLLAAIEARSGVPKEILVAIWGMETDYGHMLGSDSLFSALATAAYMNQGPRRAHAESELIAALRLLQQENYPVSEMVGSWAGAFGQTQFMPSTFFKYATDGDGDGRIDLWRSAPDALASTAALLRQEGWQAGKPWGYEVRLPPGFDYGQAGLGTQRPLSDWAAMGVETATGAALPAGNDPAALYLPAGMRGPAFLLSGNFNVIMKYNNAASYALAVGLLADRMAGAAPLAASWPRDERPLSREERIRFQSELAQLGYDPGTPDGLLGRKTRAALTAYQKAKGLPADGWPDAAMLAALDADAAHVTAAR